MSYDTLEFLSPVDRVRVAAMQRKARFGHIALISFGVAVTIVLYGVSLWLGA